MAFYLRKMYLQKENLDKSNLLRVIDKKEQDPDLLVSGSDPYKNVTVPQHWFVAGVPDLLSTILVLVFRSNL
jgi:hypothetical protein